MKTKTISRSLALLAAAAMTSVALGGLEFPRFTKPRTSPKPIVTHTLPVVCKDQGCCGKKLVPVGPHPRNWSELIRTCKTHCPVNDADRRAQCGEGNRS